MKVCFSALILAMALLGGCRKAVFTNIEEPRANSNDLNGGNGDGLGEPGTDDITGKKLIVSVPVTELPFGGKTTQATAKIGGIDEPVTWKVEDPTTGKPVGTITDKGEYKTPETGTPTTVKIIATSKKDPAIKGEVPLKLVKPQLIVSVPVPEIKVGSNNVTAVAELNNGTKNPPVKWSISGPGMRDIGKINESTGVYTSPATGTESFAIIITANLLADPSISGSTNLTIVPVNAGDAELIVEVPSKEIRSGGKEMQATARLKDGTLNPPVTWSIMGPTGKTPGTISDKGVYKSPATAPEAIPVVITATLIANPAIKASVTITVLKDDQIFARCTKGTMFFPILADVYEINSTATKLPNFDNTSEARKITTVCMDKYAVAPRYFDAGFPDVPGVFEWFALKTKTQIVIPQDGIYTFYLNSDDGSKLYIDGLLVIDNDGHHQAMGPHPEDSPTTGQKEVTLSLLKGDHDLRLDYFQGPKWRIALELKWKKPGSSTVEYVPSENFK